MKLFLLIDVTLSQISTISGFYPCIATVYDPVQSFPICFCKALITLVFVSGDQKLPLWYYISLEGIGLATIHCQKPSWHWGLLNITTYWIYWFYFFFFIWNCFSATVAFWTQAVVLFFNIPIKEQYFKHLNIFFFTTCRRVLGFDPVSTWDVLKLAHTFIYLRLDYCESCQTSCSDTAVRRFTTVNTVRAEIYSIF